MFFFFETILLRNFRISFLVPNPYCCFTHQHTTISPFNSIPALSKCSTSKSSISKVHSKLHFAGNFPEGDLLSIVFPSVSSLFSSLSLFLSYLSLCLVPHIMDALSLLSSTRALRLLVGSERSPLCRSWFGCRDDETDLLFSAESLLCAP